MIKRFADWLEKISVAAFAVGIFQTQRWGLIITVIALSASMALTKYLEKKEK